MFLNGFKVPRLRLSFAVALVSQMQLQRYKKNGRFARVLPKKLQFILGFNTLFWTKKTGERQTGKNTSLTYSEYVVRGLSVRPLRTGFLTIFQLSSAKQVETACDPLCDPLRDPFLKRVTCLSPDKHWGFRKNVRV